MTVAEARLALDKHITDLRALSLVHASGEPIRMCFGLISDDVDQLVTAAKADGAREEVDRMVALADEATRLGHA